MSTVLPVVISTSPFWNNNYQQMVGRSSCEYQVSRNMASPGFRTVRRVLRALVGTAAGGSKVETVAQIAPATPFQDATSGGVRPVNTVTLQAGVTTASDVTYINAMVDRVFTMQPTIANYPVDLSGNGGGDKRGF